MLTLAGSEEKQSSNFMFIGMNNEGGKSVHLLSNTTSLLAPVNGEDYTDSCSFYSGPSDSTIFAFGESLESCGSIAYSTGTESCGSIAYSAGTESCGSIASSSVSSCSGSACSYSC